MGADMAAPKTVRVGPHRISIKIDETAHNASQAAEQTSLYGRYDPATNTITVQPGLHPDQEADTILHEILHAVATGTGLTATGGALEDQSRQEQVVSAMAPALLDLLRRNRALVDYLTA